MKLPKKILVVGFLLALSVWLGGAGIPNSTPGPQSDEGVILLMDYSGRNLTIQSAECGQRVTFFWTPATQFIRGGQRVLAESFEAGMEVRVFYRREAGRNMLREVTWHKDPMFAVP